MLNSQHVDEVVFIHGLFARIRPTHSSGTLPRTPIEHNDIQKITGVEGTTLAEDGLGAQIFNTNKSNLLS